MKPSKQQLEMALAAARRLSEDDLDTEHMAKVLLYLWRRVLDLERVREQTERYVLFGMAVEDHRKLLQILQQAREHERVEAGEDAAEFGLGGGSGT